MVLTNLLFLLLYSYAFFIISVAIHFFILNKSTGSYQRKEASSFNEILQEEGLSILFQYKVIFTLVSVIYGQQKMFFKSRTMKRNSEDSMQRMMELLARISLREIQGIPLTESEEKARLVAKENVLILQSDLLYIKEELGYDSLFLSQLSDTRIKEIRSGRYERQNKSK